HVSAVLAALVNHAERAAFGDDHRVVPRDPGVRYDQVLVGLASYGEGAVVQRNEFLLIALNEDQLGENGRTRFRLCDDCLKSHGGWEALSLQNFDRICAGRKGACWFDCSGYALALPKAAKASLSLS